MALNEALNEALYEEWEDVLDLVPGAGLTPASIPDGLGADPLVELIPAARGMVEPARSAFSASPPLTLAPSAPLAPVAPAPPQPEVGAAVVGMSYGMLIFREVLETLVLTLILFMLIRVGIQNYKIEGQSMQPNFEDGQYLLVNKLTYVFNEPRRGDVVVFHYPRDPERDFIKRVVGLPGDTVEVRDGRVFVNGSLLDEPYDTLPINYSAGLTVVDPGTVYVLGDNRGNSEDSHRWGLLNQDLIIGTAWFTIYPFSLAGTVDHTEPNVGTPTALGPS